MRYFVIIILILGLFIACNQDEDSVQQAKFSEIAQFEDNPVNAEVPPATVEILDFSDYVLKSVEVEHDMSTLTPELFEATLSSGESADEDKLAHLASTPPKGDIMFMLDLTGSMGGELNNAKANSTNIMNALRALIPDTYFGAISHMDYNGQFSGCGYSSVYGGSVDYPYSLDQALTATTSDVTNAINALTLGGGADGPESYSRALWETVNDGAIGWRTGSKRIVVAWMDNVPHDCAYNAILGGATSTGPDPGRDEVVGTADDPVILDVLSAMDDENITLIAMCSNSSQLSLWQAYAEETGGTAFLVNPDGTIPGGVDIATQISQLIEEEVSFVEELTLEVCTQGFEEWMTDLEPMAYYDVTLPGDFEFTVTYTVPPGTEDGVYEFDVCVVGDGVIFARQHVVITVRNELDVAFDVHPTSCPNPINRNSGGVLPVAILGTADFDVSEINIETVEISGISPVRYAMEDVATPYEPFTDKPEDRFACTTEGPDGYTDLTLKFNYRDISALLDGAEVGDVIILTITGELLDGTPFHGEDVVWIVK